MATATTVENTSASFIQVPHLITLGEAAEIFGTSLVTVRRMVSRGELKAYTFGGRNLRIDAASVRGALSPVAAWTPAK